MYIYIYIYMCIYIYIYIYIYIERERERERERGGGGELLSLQNALVMPECVAPTSFITIPDIELEEKCVCLCTCNCCLKIHFSHTYNAHKTQLMRKGFLF